MVNALFTHPFSGISDSWHTTSSTKSFPEESKKKKNK